MFAYDSDLDLVALVEGNAKTLLAICQVVHKAFEKSVPDVGLQHHQHSAMTRMHEGTEVEMFCRNKIVPQSKTLGFIPDSLDDRALAETVLKRSVFGAVFNDCKDKMPQSGDVGVIWEVALDTNPPAQIKALKPKFWVKGKLAMKPDHVYQITA